MTPGLSTHVFFDQRLHPGLLDALAGAGARTIEVFAARHHFDYTDAQQVREVASWFRANDVRATLHQPIYLTDGSRAFSHTDPGQYSRHIAPNLNLISERKNARIAAMDEMKRALESAEHIPFTASVLHLGLKDSAWDEAAIDYSLTAVEHLKAFAGPLGIRLLLENLQNEVTTPEHLLHILRVGHFDSVGVCLDLGHLYLAADHARAVPGSAAAAADREVDGERSSAHNIFAETAALLGQRIGALHVHDNHGPFGDIQNATDMHDEHLWPGEGAIEWATVTAAFASLPSETPAILEPGPIRDLPADQVRQKAEAAFRELFEPQPA